MNPTVALVSYRVLYLQGRQRDCWLRLVGSYACLSSWTSTPHDRTHPCGLQRARAVLHRDKPPSPFFCVAIWNRAVSDPKEHSKPPPPLEVRLPHARYLVLRSGRRPHLPRLESPESLGLLITPHCASLGESWKSPSIANETGLGIWRAGTSVPSRVLLLERDSNSSRHRFGNLA